MTNDKPDCIISEIMACLGRMSTREAAGWLALIAGRLQRRNILSDADALLFIHCLDSIFTPEFLDDPDPPDQHNQAA